MTLSQTSAVEVEDLNNLWWHFLQLEFRTNSLFYSICALIFMVASVLLFLSIARRRRQKLG